MKANEVMKIVRNMRKDGERDCREGGEVSKYVLGRLLMHYADQIEALAKAGKKSKEVA